MKKTIIVLIFNFLMIMQVFAAIDGNLAMEAIQAKEEGNLQKLHIVAQKIILKNPEDPYGYNLEAEFLFETKKYEEAIKYYSKVIEKSKMIKEYDSASLRKMGWNEEIINSVLNYDSSIAEAYNLRGLCFFELSKYKEALNDFLEAEKYKSNHTDVSIMIAKALCLAFSDQYDNAIKLLNEAKSYIDDEKDLEKITKMIDIVNTKKKNISTNSSQQETEKFYGIGAFIEPGKNDYPMITRTYPDYPAYKAGIDTKKNGAYQIVKVNGKDMQGLSIEETIKMIKGKENTYVDLEIIKAGSKKIKKYHIKREAIYVKR